MQVSKLLESVKLPDSIVDLLKHARSVTIATNIKELEVMACPERKPLTVSFSLPDGTVIEEADVVPVKNGISANYREAYMRRRDPDCMVIGDDRPSDKPHYRDRYGVEFKGLKDETFAWLKDQDLAVFGFEMGRTGLGADALAICPVNAGFFAFGLGLLQGIVDLDSLDREFLPKSVIYVAPPFRHTHFKGKQVVVHDRTELHEIFSYNLYPGPSAKKGVYGALIELGEQEGWVTTHCSAVEVITPYDNVVTFMHEGASGGGKSEMLQQPHRLPDGRLLVGKNLKTGVKRFLEIPRTCDLRPVCDDMGLCHPKIQEGKGRLGVIDAENSWFMRVDHIKQYGTDPDLEALTIHPGVPQLFLNVDAQADATALIWEHIEDAPGKPCPNPRVVIPREIVPNVVPGKVDIDIRSFGVRCPPCSSELPTYGIMGLLHLLPPSLAWLWRLVAPRGHANPSILDDGKMGSEGVGSYWPFATGKKIAQANLLLNQFRDNYDMRYVLIPNQHIGIWKTDFMPQWLVRDYLARRGHARFSDELIEPSRCALLGYAMRDMRIEGSTIPRYLLQVDLQPEVGPEAYDAGAKILTTFFHEQVTKFNHSNLDPLGKKIIDCCLSGGTVKDYDSLIVHG